MKKLYIFLGLVLVLCGCQNRRIDSLYNYKTDFVGDNSSVSQIVSRQDYPKGFEVGAIEILSSKSPYGLKIFVKDTSNINREDLFINAIETFALIKNLDRIYYVESGRDFEEEKNKELKDKIFIFYRKEIEEILEEKNTSIEEISKDRESFEDFVNNWNK
ncbi:DUF4825 domain-containing protein [Peptoniphilus harei]|uniref:DUF4825 domain-containing protein n=1 Tax=Peptoniphilus harei TaxID=54005 RepID=A0A2X1XWJ7_9FIRM|nr:DUF4825 domain-containing protein [Peptoniphilus harei]MDU5471146.1 DUF4825 domain-containing protein [Peptoniphilus harei]MDU6097822.1 DUF4825 domain-containing protein [Peptoniphilus harei]QQT90283.1 DUF4825 domain-containing protein [Peptoniphilus harei]SPY47013.1 Uncharacterised protein [Peptoniphilus harei]